jgi:hypothetical protein
LSRSIPPNIGDSYVVSIGRTYINRVHTRRVSRGTQRTVWARLKEALADKKLPPTQTHAASILGIKQSSVAEWNRLGIYPKMEHAVELARRLGICVEWLLTGRGPKHPPPAGDSFADQLWAVWPDLSDDAKRDILGHARGAHLRDDPTATLPNPTTPAPPHKSPALRAAKS